MGNFWLKDGISEYLYDASLRKEVVLMQALITDSTMSLELVSRCDIHHYDLLHGEYLVSFLWVCLSQWNDKSNGFSFSPSLFPLFLWKIGLRWGLRSQKQIKSFCLQVWTLNEPGKKYRMTVSCFSQILVSRDQVSFITLEFYSEELAELHVGQQKQSALDAASKLRNLGKKWRKKSKFNSFYLTRSVDRVIIHKNSVVPATQTSPWTSRPDKGFTFCHVLSCVHQTVCCLITGSVNT